MDHRYTAPQGEIEEVLAQIWQDLLEVDRVSREDNFFELGGDSLGLVQMRERLRRLGKHADARQAFQSRTLADMAAAVRDMAPGSSDVPPNLIPASCERITPQMLPLVHLDEEEIECVVQSTSGGAANIQDIYPLTPAQQQLLFHYVFSTQNGDVYVLATLLSVSSRDRLDQLIAALQSVVERHDVLRTAIFWERLQQPVQVVHRHATLPLKEVSLRRDLDPTEQLREWMQPERQKLDLRRAPLMHLQVAPDLHSSRWYARLQLHHTICDHVTMEMFVSEVIAHMGGSVSTLPAPVQYRNHVAQLLAHSGTRNVEAFFRSKLGDVRAPTVPFGVLDVYGSGGQVGEAVQQLEHVLAQRVRIQARRLAVSVASLFHAACGLAIAHMSGRDDVVFGSVLLGRLQSSAGTRGMLGMFVNTLPLRLRLLDVTAETLVRRTHLELVELQNHEYASLPEANRCSLVVKSVPLFNTSFNYRHRVSRSKIGWSNTEGIQPLATLYGTNFPIALHVEDLGETFALTAQTDRRIDTHLVISTLRSATQSLVDALEHTPQLQALSIPGMTRSSLLA